MEIYHYRPDPEKEPAPKPDTETIVSRDLDGTKHFEFHGDGDPLLREMIEKRKADAWGNAPSSANTKLPAPGSLPALSRSLPRNGGVGTDTRMAATPRNPADPMNRPDLSRNGSHYMLTQEAREALASGNLSDLQRRITEAYLTTNERSSDGPRAPTA